MWCQSDLSAILWSQDNLSAILMSEYKHLWCEGDLSAILMSEYKHLWCEDVLSWCYSTKYTALKTIGIWCYSTKYTALKSISTRHVSQDIIIISWKYHIFSLWCIIFCEVWGLPEDRFLFLLLIILSTITVFWVFNILNWCSIITSKNHVFFSFIDKYKKSIFDT